MGPRSFGRTCIVGACLLLILVVQKGLGIGIPGAEVGHDWLFWVRNALGHDTLRARIARGSP